VGWWLERPWRFRPKVGIVALVLFLALVAIVSSLALTHATAQDAGLYFVQSTLWVQRFRVVPGLADLHPCLGYNQTYFFWVGAFSGGPFSDRPWVVANGILFLAAAGPGILALAQLVTRPAASVEPSDLLVEPNLAVGLNSLRDNSARNIKNTIFKSWRLVCSARSLAIMAWIPIRGWCLLLRAPLCSTGHSSRWWTDSLIASRGAVRTQVQQNLLPAGRAGPPQRRTLAFAEFFCGRESRVVGLLLGWNGMQSGRDGTFSSKTELAAISQITLPSPRCTIDLAIGYSSLDPAEMAPSPGSMHRKGGVVKVFCTG
jgi:hypothetical protein